MLKLGIVGLPNVGKSTLFNALTAARAEAANYPFCTVEPNVGMVEVPGSQDFKIMVLTDEWKYIFMANGGHEQLFNRKKDPNELSNCVSSSPAIRSDLYALAVKACRVPGATDALDGDKLRAVPFRQRPATRIYQFDRSRGVVGFPDKPQDALKIFDRATLRSLE